jgi:hypothetical protein
MKQNRHTVDQIIAKLRRVTWSLARRSKLLTRLGWLLIADMQLKAHGDTLHKTQYCAISSVRRIESSRSDDAVISSAQSPT